MAPRPSSGLVVLFQGRQVAGLRPGNPPFTFGRGHDRTLRFGHDSVDGGPDLHLSRHVGSIRYSGGLWVVHNDSGSRPFDVIVRGVANPLPPHTASDSHSRWAVSPPGLAIRVGAPSGRYLFSISISGSRAPVTRPARTRRAQHRPAAGAHQSREGAACGQVPGTARPRRRGRQPRGRRVRLHGTAARPAGH